MAKQEQLSKSNVSYSVRLIFTVLFYFHFDRFFEI